MSLEALRDGHNGYRILVAVTAPTPMAIRAVVAAVASHGGLAIPAVVDLMPRIEPTAVRSPA